MTINISNYLDRITELQTAAVADTQAAFKGIDKSASYPYWTNELVNVARTRIAAYQYRYDITITMRLHQGHLSEGYDIDIEAKVQQNIFTVMEYFDQHRDLQTSTYTASQAGFVPRSADVNNGRIVLFGNQSSQDIGAEFTLTFSHIGTSPQTATGG